MATIAVLGGGNGGFAAAAHLSALGEQVHLYSRSPATLRIARERGGIAYSGVAGEGLAAVACLTNDLAEALAGAELVMLCVPATAFADLARALAPLLAQAGGPPVLLNPGNTGGSLAFRRLLIEAGCASPPPIAETNTLTYICRKQGEGEVYISSLVQHVRLAVLPASAAERLWPLLSRLYPSLRPVEHVLVTALSNVNAVLHPPGMVLSAAWIEHSGGDFRYYYDAGTPAVAQVMADLDRERLAVAAAWGLSLEPFPQLFADLGSTSPEAGASGSFLRMLRESAPNQFIKAPANLDSRYLHEDIPFGLVPMSELGRALGVATPVMDALITLASCISRRDYRAEGWTLARLGLPPEREAALAVLR
ncbi:MAG: NAD/NADP octopine/nopaline dehydrogenase family protein [Thermogemmatispora sp.]|uniref:NAD/NADP octopine/nopaline dehydrogenase family protein n=1 Tax=Thermogemmatispora sp. TaxID=1968838 RepID=UPI0026193542|nr:NAD/NADP octopine/nopaline dehydrogenase family protein [Thermogemmatispora sp.]MBX5457371.1 NAD/NADP octopine/nopaline dehydrogenase family protein [Thermogemmatispora sp.]